MINKITIKNGVRIIDNDYVIKDKKSDVRETYNYLLARSFNYFPEIIKEDNNKIYYKYIPDISEPREQKIIDLTMLLSLLHNKTTFYREVDLDYYKYIYESVNQEIDSIYSYYNNLMDNIENELYMSPANYLIARNISSIYSSLAYAKENIKKWYELIEDKRKVRLVTIHNNLSLDHYIKNDKPYLVSWDRAKIDMPVYDLVSLYKHHYLDFEFSDIFKLYLSKYQLSKEEMLLFLSMIAIPDRIKYTGSEYKTVLSVRRIIDYVYKTRMLLKEYSIKEETNKGQKLNK